MSVTPLLEAFGVPATVTRPSPDDDPIATPVIWLSPEDSDRPYGTDYQRREPRRVMGVPRTTVAGVPRGTLVVAPELLGGTDKTWRVDEMLRSADVDLWRLAVVQVGTPQ